MGEAGIYSSDSPRRRLKIHIAYATPAVLLWQEAHREAELIALDIGALDDLEGLLSVRLLVGNPYSSWRIFNSDFSGVSLQPLLRAGEREIDGHGCIPEIPVRWCAVDGRYSDEGPP